MYNGMRKDLRGAKRNVKQGSWMVSMQVNSAVPGPAG